MKKFLTFIILCMCIGLMSCTCEMNEIQTVEYDTIVINDTIVWEIYDTVYIELY